MKKALLILVAITASYCSYAQTNTFPSTGFVGIGTTSPSTLLHVSGSSSNTGIFALIENTFAGGYGANTQYKNTSQSWLSGMVQNTGITRYSIYDITNSTERLSILNNGNVGIGTSTPLALLHIKNLSGLDYLQITKSSTSPNLDIYSAYNGSDDLQSGSFGYGVRSSSQSWEIWEKHTNGIWNNLFSVQINGNIGIGTTNPQNKLDVNGTIHSKQVNVDLNGWPDYVFKNDYQLPTLQEVKTFIDQNHHLPEMPTEQQVAKDGLNLGEMNKLLTKKVEELTLYLIELKREKDQKEKEQEIRIGRLEEIIQGQIAK